jgi:hypothetical protein
MDPNQLAVAVGTAAGLVISAAVGGVVLILNTRQGHASQNRDQELREHKDLLERQDKRLDKLEVENQRLRDDETECRVRLSRAVARIERLEETLSSSNIPFRPWKPDETDTHRPHGV